MSQAQMTALEEENDTLRKNLRNAEAKNSAAVRAV